MKQAETGAFGNIARQKHNIARLSRYNFRRLPESCFAGKCRTSQTLAIYQTLWIYPGLQPKPTMHLAAIFNKKRKCIIWYRLCWSAASCEKRQISGLCFSL